MLGVIKMRTLLFISIIKHFQIEQTSSRCWYTRCPIHSFYGDLKIRHWIKNSRNCMTSHNFICYYFIFNCVRMQSAKRSTMRFWWQRRESSRLRIISFWKNEQWTGIIPLASFSLSFFSLNFNSSSMDY